MEKIPFTFSIKSMQLSGRMFSSIDTFLFPNKEGKMLIIMSDGILYRSELDSISFRHEYRAKVNE